jgi:tetratricopeptide (TPR) repeat protein
VPKSRIPLAVGFVLAYLSCMAPAPPCFSGEMEKMAKQEMRIGYKAARRGYWLEALHRFENANEYTPNQPRILNNIAVAMEASGRFEEALVTYESAMVVAPKDRVLRSNYSRFKEFYETMVAPPTPVPEPKKEKPPDPDAEQPVEESTSADDGADEEGESDDDTTSG